MARADGAPPVCAADTPPALVFKGLPKALQGGDRDEFGFVDNADSDASVPGRIGIRELDRYDDYLLSGEIGPGARGGHLFRLPMHRGDGYVQVKASYEQVTADGSSCINQMSRRVRERHHDSSVSCGYASARAGSDRIIAHKIGGHELSCVVAHRTAEDFVYSVASRGDCYSTTTPRACRVGGFKCKGSAESTSHGFRTRCTRDDAIVKFYEYDKAGD